MRTWHMCVRLLSALCNTKRYIIQDLSQYPISVSLSSFHVLPHQAQLWWRSLAAFYRVVTSLGFPTFVLSKSLSWVFLMYQHSHLYFWQLSKFLQILSSYNTEYRSVVQNCAAVRKAAMPKYVIWELYVLDILPMTMVYIALKGV